MPDKLLHCRVLVLLLAHGCLPVLDSAKYHQMCDYVLVYAVVAIWGLSCRIIHVGSNRVTTIM